MISPVVASLTAKFIYSLLSPVFSLISLDPSEISFSTPLSKMAIANSIDFLVATPQFLFWSSGYQNLMQFIATFLIFKSLPWAYTASEMFDSLLFHWHLDLSVLC